ncbi:MAG TPA: zf-HC2 domain-containing protein [Balneolales bacterium]|nr:zf-HC2 domain-containing protein [Balneolales bacterium]
MKLKMKFIKTVTDLVTPPCEDITRLISKSQDTELSLKEKWQVRIHIIGCKLCYRYQQQIKKMNALLKKSKEIFEKKDVEDGEGLSREAYKKIKSDIDKNLNK